MFREVVFYTFITFFFRVQAQRFPDNFIFGAGTAAFQCEGAWNVDGKGPSILDDSKVFVDHETQGDVGSDSYYHYLEDVEGAKKMNLSTYRFSIAWTRVLPNGDMSFVNEKGIDYYNKVIDSCIERNIEPMVTMVHFDWPSQLQKIGGFSNPLFVDYAKDYANLLFERYGDRVKYWITFNEPFAFCSTHILAQGIVGTSEYFCADTVLKSHATIYRSYRRKFYRKQKGQVGITLNSPYFYPKTANDASVAERALQFNIGWFARPLFKGNYPQVMIDRIGRNSEKQGFPKSRLPTLCATWRNRIRGSLDFLGFNYYKSKLVEETDEDLLGMDPSYDVDKNAKESNDPNWPLSSSKMPSVPQGLYDLLKWIKEEYDNPNVIITENGYSDYGELEDNGRIQYLYEHLQVIQRAILKDKCNVIGYMAWSLIDQYEWFDIHYSTRFGLISVDMDSPNKDRTPKKSAGFMEKVATSHQIPPLDN